MPASGLPTNGSALTAITSRKPKKIGEEPCESRRERASARANRQQNFLAERVLELFEVEGRLAFVTEHFQDRGATFFRHFHAATFHVYDMHLQRLDQEVPVVAAIGTSQRHISLLFENDSMRWLRRTQCIYGCNLIHSAAHASNGL